jgi:hypothetical protein
VWWTLIIFALMVEFFEKFVNNIKKNHLIDKFDIVDKFLEGRLKNNGGSWWRTLNAVRS